MALSEQERQAVRDRQQRRRAANAEEQPTRQPSATSMVPPGPMRSLVAMGEVAEKYTPGPVKDIAGKAIHAISVPDYALANIIAEARAGNIKGPGSLADAATAGVREHTSYSKAFGEGPLATTLDVVGPAGFGIPFGTAGKLIGGGAKAAKMGAAAGIAAGVAKSARFSDAVDVTKKAGSEIRKLGDLEYKLRSEGVEEAIPSMRRRAGAHAAIAWKGVSEEAKEIRSLLTTPESNRRTITALDAHPVELMEREIPELEEIGKQVDRLLGERERIQDKLLSAYGGDVSATKAPPRGVMIRHYEKPEDISSSKPHGLYFSMGSKSPHASAGSKKLVAVPSAGKVLNVPQGTVSHKRFGAGGSGEASAGVMALKALLPETKFNQLLMSNKEQIIQELRGAVPRKSLERYHDEYELLEVYGAHLAREKGYDAIRQVDRQMPEFSEYVALNKRAYRPASYVEQHTRGEEFALKTKGYEARVEAIDREIQSRLMNAGILRQASNAAVADEYAMNLARWKGLYDGLSPAEKKAYDIGKKMVLEDEQTKLAEGILDQAKATGFGQKEGTLHVPRRLKSVKAIDKLLKNATDPDEIDLLQHAREIVSGKHDSVFKTMVSRRGIRQPGYLKERKLGPLAELKGPASEIFELEDMAKILELNRVDTAKAVADKIYLKEIEDVLERSGVWADAVENIPKGWQKFPSHLFPGLSKDKMVPSEVADELLQSFKRSTDPQGVQIVKRVFRDFVTLPWRNITLFLAPEFYTRNVVSSAHNNYVHLGMGADAAQDYAKAGDDISRWFVQKKFKPGEEKTVESMIQNRLLNAGQADEWDQFTGTGKKIMERPFTPFQKAHQNIENWQRLSAFYYLRRKGMPVEEAIDKVIKTHFDYGLGLTDVERKVRNLFPFYAWTRFNLPLQLEMLAKNPGRYANVARGVRAAETLTGGPDVDETTLPPWMSDDAHMRIFRDKETGKSQHVRLSGYLPSAELEKLTGLQRVGRELVSQAHPVPKWLLESTTGVDLFRSTPGKVVATKDVAKGNILGIPVGTKTEYAARQIRPINLADRYKETYEASGGGLKGAGRTAIRAVFGSTQVVDPNESRERYLKQVERKISDIKRKKAEARKEKDHRKLKQLTEDHQLLVEEKRDVLERARRQRAQSATSNRP